MQSIDSIETYAYGASKDLVSEKEEIKFNNTTKQLKNFDDVAKENIKEHNSNWQQIPDHPYRILTIAGSGSRKANSIFNLISQQPDIDKIYLYGKDPYEAKHILINKLESTGLKHLNDSKAFIEYQNNLDDIYKNIEEYNTNRKSTVLTVNPKNLIQQ